MLSPEVAEEQGDQQADSPRVQRLRSLPLLHDLMQNLHCFDLDFHCKLHAND
jgi:hypothetical protein